MGNIGTEQDFEVERIIPHHSYKQPYGMAHDIAMLKLRRPAQINRAVGMACLPGSSGRVPDGKRCWVTGIINQTLNYWKRLFVLPEWLYLSVY